MLLKTGIPEAKERLMSSKIVGSWLIVCWNKLWKYISWLKIGFGSTLMGLMTGIGSHDKG